MLSQRTKDIVVVALADRRAGQELASAVDAGGNSQAATVAALGVTANLVGVDGTGSNAAPLVGTEARLDAIEAKIDAILASIKAAGLMA